MSSITTYLTFLSLLLCMACSFDGDLEYIPRTQAAYFLIQDTFSGPKSILSIQKGRMISSWQEQIGLSTFDLGDMSGNERSFWVSDVARREVLEIDLSNQLVKNRFVVKGLSPHLICIGERQMLISDTSQYKIGFMELKSGALLIRAVDALPGFATYRSQKFFLVSDGNQIDIYHEKALAKLNTITLSQKIDDIQLDNGFYTYIYGYATRGGFEGRIDYSTNALSAEVVEKNFLKSRLSPYKRQNYGREWVLNQLLDERRTIKTINNIQDYEVDFFESNLYYRKDDSLFVYNYIDQSQKKMGAFTSNFLKSYFFIEP